MPNYLKAAQKAKTPKARKRFLRLHHEGKVRNQILTCHRCHLRETCSAPVPWSGPTDAELVLVGEAPGKNEDEQGEPFVGQAGGLLNAALLNVGTERDEVMVVNSICCRPPDNRTPSLDEQNACRVNLNDQLDMSEATVGVVMGGAAIQTISGEPNIRVGQWRGHPFWALGRVWMPTWHPAYVLRNRNARDEMTQDLARALQLARNPQLWPGFTVEDVPEHPKWQKVKLKKRLKDQGWVAVDLPGWKRRMVVIESENRDVTIPGEYMSYPVITLEELSILGVWAKGRNRTISKSEISAMLLVKQELGGRVVGTRK